MTAPGLGTWIERRALHSPRAISWRSSDVELTYLELAHMIRGLADQLVRRGIAPGDRVAYHGGNLPAALVSLFATTAIGSIWVPIHPSRPEHEVLSVLSDATPRLLIRCEPDTQPGTDIPELSVSDLDGDGSQSRLPDRDPTPDDLVILAYTSGTTGDPKGVMLTESNVAWNVVQMLAACGFTSNDVSLAAAPFTRMGGLGVTVLPTLFAGGMIVVPPALDGSSVLRTIEHDRVTVVFANPDLLEHLVVAREWAGSDLSSVRTGVVGGGLVPEPLLRAFLDRGVKLRHGYGLTEAAPVVSLLDDRDAAARPASVGKPLPFVDVRTLRPDGSPCDPDEIGEWSIRGPNVCAGYWGLPPVIDEGGWFPTGDLGSIDAEGYLTFLDRASSAMRIDGTTVYPATVEVHMYGVPGVDDAAVVEVGGRLIAAVVPARGTEVDAAALLAPLRESLPPPAVPSEIRAVDGIPRNAAGKVRRDELRTLLAER
jgi:fatty-acyl-CoA synthase